MTKKKLKEYDYYGNSKKDIAGSYSSLIMEPVAIPAGSPHRPPHRPSFGPPPPIEPCRPSHGIEAIPAPPWEAAVAEHNLEHTAHPYLLELFKTNTSNYYCKDTIAARDAIGLEIRTEGLMCYVVATDEVYRLEDGIENSDWKALNINSGNYAKIGRYNPPSNAEDGMFYFDLSSSKLRFYLGGWQDVPTQKDVENAILNHDADLNAHSAQFKAVENAWLAI